MGGAAVRQSGIAVVKVALALGGPAGDAVSVHPVSATNAKTTGAITHHTLLITSILRLAPPWKTPLWPEPPNPSGVGPQ